MKKCMIMLTCIVLFITITGCARRGRQAPILSREQEDFDIDIAYKMIEELEEPIRLLNERTVVTKDELISWIDKYELLKSERIPTLGSYFDMGLIENLEKQEYEVQNYFYYPTLNDEDIEITKAYIETIVYDLSTEHSSATETRVTLCIVQEYTGQDKNKQGFNRRYDFAKYDSDNWELIGIGGGHANVRIGEDGWTMNDGRMYMFSDNFYP